MALFGFYLILFYIASFALMGLYVYVPFWIKKRIIKHKHSQQLMAMQTQARNPLKRAKHPFVTELTYSLAFFFSSGGFLICLLFFVAAGAAVFDGDKERYQYMIDRFLLYTLLFYLLDLIVFYIRMAAGRIQGAVLYDPKDKKVYAFRSVNSDCYSGGYKEYHESELVYATYRNIRKQFAYQFFFFTADEGKKAFSVMAYIFRPKDFDFISMMSNPQLDDMPIPRKNFILTAIYFLVSFHTSALIIYLFIDFNSMP